MTQPIPNQPELLVVIAGTGTEVGKTWVGAALATALRSAGTTVQARKPAQSFEPDDPAEGTDAALLGAATGEAATTVCPSHRWYPTAMAPPMAADALGRPRLTLAELVDEVSASWTAPAPQVGLVELAGGVFSPHTHDDPQGDGDGVALTRALSPDHVVLVADAGLGTINAIRPALTALATIAPVTVVLNRYDADSELHRRNRDWLRDHDGLDPVTSVEELAGRLGS